MNIEVVLTETRVRITFPQDSGAVVRKYLDDNGWRIINYSEPWDGNLATAIAVHDKPIDVRAVSAELAALA